MNKLVTCGDCGAGVTIKDDGLVVCEKCGFTEEECFFPDKKCSHPNAYVVPPCCSSPGASGYYECGCGGRYQVYCPDCNDLTDDEADEILRRYFDEEDY